MSEGLIDATLERYAKRKGKSLEEVKKFYGPMLRKALEKKEERLLPQELLDDLMRVAEVSGKLSGEAAVPLQMLAVGGVEKALKSGNVDPDDVAVKAINKVAPVIASLKAMDKLLDAAFPASTTKGGVSEDVQTLVGTVNQLVTAWNKKEEAEKESLADKALKEIASLREELATKEERKEKSVLLQKIEQLEAAVNDIKQGGTSKPEAFEITLDDGTKLHGLEAMEKYEEVLDRRAERERKKKLLDKELERVDREMALEERRTRLLESVPDRVARAIYLGMMEGEEGVVEGAAKEVIYEVGEDGLYKVACPYCQAPFKIPAVHKDVVTCPTCTKSIRITETG